MPKTLKHDSKAVDRSTQTNDYKYLASLCFLYNDQKMKGTVRPISRQTKCPKCGKAFQYFPKLGYGCSNCKTVPNRLCIDLHWHGRRVRICSDKAGQPLDTYQRAWNLLSIIQGEIDNHTFDPQYYIKVELEKYYFSNQIKGWINSKENEKKKGKIAPSTLKTYRVYINKYFIPFFNNQDCREIRTPDIKRFYHQLPDNMSLKYQKCLMTTLEGFFNTLVEDEVISHKPSFKSTDITIPETTPQWIDRDTQDRILSLIDDKRDTPIYQLLTRQGIRPSEARALKIRDLDLAEGTITVNRTYSEHEIIERNKEKKCKPRLLNPQLLPMLKEICKNRFPEDFVFINHRTGNPYNRSIFNKIWNAASKKAGIKIRLYNATRHSIGTQASRAGVPDSEIAEVLNHCDDRMVKKHYVNKAELEKQRVVFDRINNVIKIDRVVAVNKPSTDFEEGSDSKV